MPELVRMRGEQLLGMLEFFEYFHPREAMLILRGRIEKEVVVVDSLMIPPLVTHGEGFASFPVHMLPMDLSIVGTAHSHPNGVLIPSTEDLIHFYGAVMAIAGHPYKSERDVKFFDREGREVEFELV